MKRRELSPQALHRFMEANKRRPSLRALAASATRSGHAAPAGARSGVLLHLVVIGHGIRVELYPALVPPRRVHLDVVLEVVPPVERLVLLLLAKRALELHLLVGTKNAISSMFPNPGSL